MKPHLFNLHSLAIFVYLNITLEVFSLVSKTMFEPLKGCELDHQFIQNATKTVDFSTKIACGRACAHTLSCQSINLIKGKLY